ncbi:MAG: pilus assembly protein [Slackia sp.]|nr:pilus assembly protein [Slackia sp.]
MRLFRAGVPSGQATVEAAFIAPLVLACILLLVQPGIVLYDRAVMESAASEGCRLLETRASQSEEDARAFIERRLDAIPDTDVFHAGSWDIEVRGSQDDEEVAVSIAHFLDPLPLIDAALGFAGLVDRAGLYRQEVTHVATVRDEWLMKSENGADPQAWMQRWEEKA